MRTLGAVRKWEYPATKWFLQYRQCKQRSQSAYPHQRDSREWLITGYQLESDDSAPPNPRAQITDYNISLSGPTGPNDNWYSQSFQSEFHQKLDVVLTSQTRPTTNMPMCWFTTSRTQRMVTLVARRMTVGRQTVCRQYNHGVNQHFWQRQLQLVAYSKECAQSYASSWASSDHMHACRHTTSTVTARSQNTMHADTIIL